MELLEGGAMDADDIADRSDHGEVIQPLGIDDHCGVDRGEGVCASFVMVGVVHYFDRADELSLGVLIRVGRINDHTEEVVLIMLLHPVNRRILKTRVDILAL